jgi:hypothetical protein
MIKIIRNSKHPATLEPGVLRMLKIIFEILTPANHR